MSEYAKPVGIYATTITAFNADESLNEKGTRAFVRFLLDSGVHGLAPMGSAGEFFALTDEERMQAMEWILDEVNGQIPVYARDGTLQHAHDHQAEPARAQEWGQGLS